MGGQALMVSALFLEVEEWAGGGCSSDATGKERENLCHHLVGWAFVLLPGKISSLHQKHSFRHFCGAVGSGRLPASRAEGSWENCDRRSAADRANSRAVLEEGRRDACLPSATAYYAGKSVPEGGSTGLWKNDCNYDEMSDWKDLAYEFASYSARISSGKTSAPLTPLPICWFCSFHWPIILHIPWEVHSTILLSYTVLGLWVRCLPVWAGGACWVLLLLWYHSILYLCYSCYRCCCCCWVNSFVVPFLLFWYRWLMRCYRFRCLFPFPLRWWSRSFTNAATHVVRCCCSFWLPRGLTDCVADSGAFLLLNRCSGLHCSGAVACWLERFVFCSLFVALPVYCAITCYHHLPAVVLRMAFVDVYRCCVLRCVTVCTLRFCLHNTLHRYRLHARFAAPAVRTFTPFLLCWLVSRFIPLRALRAPFRRLRFWLPRRFCCCFMPRCRLFLRFHLYVLPAGCHPLVLGAVVYVLYTWFFNYGLFAGSAVLRSVSLLIWFDWIYCRSLPFVRLLRLLLPRFCCAFSTLFCLPTLPCSPPSTLHVTSLRYLWLFVDFVLDLFTVTYTFHCVVLELFIGRGSPGWRWIDGWPFSTCWLQCYVLRCRYPRTPRYAFHGLRSAATFATSALPFVDGWLRCVALLHTVTAPRCCVPSLDRSFDSVGCCWLICVCRSLTFVPFLHLPPLPLRSLFPAFLLILWFVLPA